MFGPCTLLVETNPGDKLSLVVTDMSNSEVPIFKVKSCNTHIHCKREVFAVLDEIEYPLFMLQKQIATLHARCDGYSTSSNDIKTFGKKLLTMSKNDILQHHTKLNVKLLGTFKDKCASLEMEEHGALLDDLLYMGSSLENEALITNMLETGESVEKDKDDCMIIGSWSKKTLTIYKPSSSTAIAKVFPLRNYDKFKVDVSSNVDCAFVISLIAAVDCLKEPAGTLKHVGKAIGVVLNATVGVAVTTCGTAGYAFVFN